MRPQKLKIDRIKEMKRISRLDNKFAGRGGFHKDKREKRQRKMSTLDYIEECKEEYKEEQELEEQELEEYPEEEE